MTDSMDEWDGGAIDGRDQYLADAPYWSDGDGETVDGTDPNATGQVTTENVPNPGDEPEIDDSDESETETSANDTPVVENDNDLREWPPNSDTLTEIRQRLIDGETGERIASEFPVHQATINKVAKGVRHSDIDAEIGPVEVKAGSKNPTWGEVDSDEQTELTNPDADDTDGSEVPTWPPNPETLTEIRRQLLNGSSTHEVSEWVGMASGTVGRAAKGDRHRDVDAEIPPLTTEGERFNAEWVVDGDSDGTGATTESEPKPEPGTEAPNSGADEDASQIDVAPGDERPVAQDPPEPETPTVPTRWIVASVAFVAGWVLSRLVRGGDDE